MIQRQYQVIGHCAHIQTRDDGGQWVTMLLPKGALLPADVPQERINHLVSVKLIAAVGAAGPELPGAAVPAAAIQPSPAPAPTPTPAAQAADPDRVAAQAKVPADGSLPHHKSGQPVWVEYLVTKGYDYDALKGQDKADLVELAKNVA